MKPYDPKILLDHITVSAFLPLGPGRAGADTASPTYSRDTVALTTERLASSHNALRQYKVAFVNTANDGWAPDGRFVNWSDAMRCMACGTEMILIDVVRDDAMAVPGFEHHTFACSGCRDVERRLVFTKRGRESGSQPMPLRTAPPIMPALTVQDEHAAASGLLSRVLAKIRGH